MKNTSLWSIEPVWHSWSNRIPPSWHPRQAQANAPKYLEGFQLLIWPRSASDWGVLAVCARLPPKSLETRVHKIPLCSFGHSTFTSITFYMIQRNLIQPCFKGRFLAFFYVCKKKAHLPSIYNQELSCRSNELATPGWLCPTLPETSLSRHCRVTLGGCFQSAGQSS